MGDIGDSGRGAHGWRRPRGHPVWGLQQRWLRSGDSGQGVTGRGGCRRGVPGGRCPRGARGTRQGQPPPLSLTPVTSQAVPRVRPGPDATRHLHTTPACLKTRAARVRVGKGDKPVTYEKAHAPHYIAHRKGWLSLHTGNLDGEPGAAERAVEDAFLRRFLYGTFPGVLADEPVLKRRANLLVVCAVLARGLAPAKLYFLLGYAETLLARFYKCPVRLELQTLPAKVPYKYL
ncbi:small ribosomal subunit protein uS3m-like [Mycteria americana]|uniref:small ribosomal subunit protein uS3m-like n=1 Tax=Mycteria americana TaxID=33587 RepID=UPI003F58F39E